jgi:hypothetical protein
MGFMRLVKGAGIGAGLMYFLDPDLGRRRRARLVDKAVGTVHHLGDALETALTDAANRAEGVWCELRRLVAPESPIDDARLEARIRTRLGRAVSHPRAIEVRAQHGRIVLSGPIFRNEVEGLLAAVSRARDVSAVENRLEVHDRPDVAVLQGEPRRTASDTAWTPAGRLAASVAGGLLMARCMRNPSPWNVLLGTVGYGLLLRAVAPKIKRISGLTDGAAVQAGRGPQRAATLSTR